MKIVYGLVVLTHFLISFNSFAQEESTRETEQLNKGRLYVFWGWNRSWYTDADIHFKGNNYDFTLNKVEATDRQSPFNWSTYFKPRTITIPQTNFRIGYFISDKIDLSFGVDHMKYVMVQNQKSKLSGSIDNGSPYNGSYTNNDFIISSDFLRFEHTDGLNYLTFEIAYNDDFLDLLKIKPNAKKIQLNYLFGFGIGAVLPKSNVTLMDNRKNDAFHLAGYGFSIRTGLDLILFKYLFFRSEYKVGFIHLPDIRTTEFKSDKASQHFLFSELTWALGFRIRPFK